jgi:FAD/FMN-containing dehydrogenase
MKSYSKEANMLEPVSGKVKEKIKQGIPYQRLKKSLKGQSLEPGDVGYEKARKVWNGMIDKRPAFIARVANTDDIITVINFAREFSVIVSVRGGGHNVSGNAVNDGGIVIDMMNMKKINVFSQTQTAQAQPGLTWGEFDKETYAHGLATTGGLVSTTGIAGFTLGGGIGWLMRKYGLTLDNLLSAEVVTADAQILRASPEENADLFWGISGGGGNFGIVTNFEFQLHPISEVLGGMIMYPVDKAKDVLQFYRNYVNQVPDELTSMAALVIAPPAPFVPVNFQGAPVIAIVGCYCGDIAKGEEALAPLRKFGQPVVDLFSPMPYTVLQQMLDPSAPEGMQNYWKSSYLNELSDDAIAVTLDHFKVMSSPLSMIHFHHMGGAMARVPESATAFGRRSATFAMNIISMWPEAVDSEKHIGWTRRLEEAIRPFATSGVYVNFLGNEGEERIKAAYGENKYKRLVELKNKYDPHNFFRLNQNIRPTK